MQQEEKKLSLDEIHAELLEQLRDITAVCKKHNISYNMMCGSLLGAVRHKGFIPWDDDVDLLMTREEFQKFREIYPKECDKRFELTYLDTWTPRVMNRDPKKAAAFTDFFILDPVPPEGFQRKWWFFKLHTLQGMLKKNVDWSRFSWKNKILIFGTHVLGLPFSVKTKTRWYEQVSRQEKTGNDLCMSNGAFELMMHIWHPDQFAEKIVVPFEGIDVLIPAKWDEVLTILFGADYMTPPPEAERVPPLTLSLDCVGDFFILFSRAYAGFRLCGGDQRAMKTDEVCDRPLDCFASPSKLVGFYRKFFPFVYLLAARVRKTQRKR